MQNPEFLDSTFLRIDLVNEWNKLPEDVKNLKNLL